MCHDHGWFLPIVGVRQESNGRWTKQGATLANHLYELDGSMNEQEKTVMADTGLEGDYYLFCFPDRMVLASKEDREDDILYFYNWAFQLVDQVRIDYPHEVPAQFLIMAETVDRLILTDSFRNVPKYYIEKCLSALLSFLGVERVSDPPATDPIGSAGCGCPYPTLRCKVGGRVDDPPLQERSANVFAKCSAYKKMKDRDHRRKHIDFTE